jgi:glutaredoxin
VIYTKENCSYCKQAKELLNKDRLKFKEHDLDSVALISPDKYQVFTKFPNSIIGVEKAALGP